MSPNIAMPDKRGCLLAFLLVWLPACATRRQQDGERKPRARCETYVAEVTNFSPNAVTVFAMSRGASGNGNLGTFVGSVAAGASQHFTLPTGMSSLRIERERGVIPRGGDIYSRTTCAPA